MLKTNSKDQKGFTIIEVLIVLAIAGLILLIVFLAVPALQRNSRNTSAKNDVQNVIGGVAEYENANSGSLPTSVSGTGTIDYKGTGTYNATSIKVQGSTVVGFKLAATAVPAAANAVSAGTITVYLGARCDGTKSTRAVAAEYAIETTGSAAVYQCIDS